MKKLSLQAFILLLCFTSVFLWEKSELTEYTIYLIGGLTVLYLISSKLRKKKSTSEIDEHELPTIILLLVSVLLLISVTGGIHSLLFFLLYFLPFYIACILTPGIVFFFALCVVLFFLPDLNNLQVESLIKMIALLLFSPLAFFLGRDIRERQQAQIEGAKILTDVSDIVKTEGNKLDEQTLSRLKDIVDASKTLQKEKND